MNSDVKVSVIVPVYNVEVYLRRCLDSLLGQTLKEIEIICVNDGSPDNSLDILSEYHAKYNEKIKVIDKKNSGVWKARYDGIKMAKGRYIMFVDPDDYVTDDYVEKLYRSTISSNSDISVCGFYRVEVETGHVYSKEMTKMGAKDINIHNNPEDILSVNTALWNKIYKTELFKDMKELDNPPCILEDMMLLLLIFPKIKSIVFIKDALYYYTVKEGSAISSVKKEKVLIAQDAMIQVKKIYENDESFKKLTPIVDAMAFLHFGISLMLRVSSDKDCNLKEEMKLNKQYLNQYFTTWKKSKYLSLWYSVTHKFANIKVAIMKKVYILNLYPLFLKLYKFMINKMKIDIKW